MADGAAAAAAAASMAMAVLRLVTICLACITCHRHAAAGAQTAVGFYSTSCPAAESIVQEAVHAYFLADTTIAPALLRLFFHDCFVRGADASILINSTAKNEAEKDGRPNLTVRGFDLINQAKMAVEKQCPGIVSCADIIALAARDAVILTGGPNYEVPCGRRDGLISLETDTQSLPAPDFPVEQARETFLEKGLSNQDFVALLGAHTIGQSRCGFFSERLYNFRGTGAADPSMNTTLAVTLEGICPNPFFSESSADPSVPLDQLTPSVFDTNYYDLLRRGEGILQIDQELITGDNATAALASLFTDQSRFFPAFVEAMVKMGNIGVLTGTQGEIRHVCSAVNSPTASAPRSSAVSSSAQGGDEASFSGLATPPARHKHKSHRKHHQRHANP